MKQITIRVDKYGKISNIQDLYLKFANENLTTEVTVDFEGVKELYNDYVKYAYIFVGKTKRGTFYTSTGNTLTFLLTQEDLQTGYITIQPAAKLPNANPELIKHVQWEHIKFDVKKSFDPITQDTTVTLSLAQILQNEIDQLELSKADKTYVDSQDLALSNRIGSNDNDILNLQNGQWVNSNIIQELLQRVEALENRTLEDFNHGGV